MTPDPPIPAASRDLRSVVFARSAGLRSAALLDRFLRHAPTHQALALDDHLAESVRQLVADGWSPLDMQEIARRKVGTALVGHLLGAAASETARHDRRRVDPRWLAELGDTQPASSSTVWARRQGAPWPQACDALIDLLVAVHRLPRLEPLLPRPGASDVLFVAAASADERVLRKVRALLAKAESTDFEEEAEAFTAKAQELMRTHAIERAVTEADGPHRSAPNARRLWLDAPYVDGKWVLVNEVAGSNHCRCVLLKDLGVATLVGYPADLDAVELLSTSLLVQATRAMNAAGSRTSRCGTSRTRSFRRSFLLAFAQRIGERLRTTASATEAAADLATAGLLVPLYTARDEAVGAALTDLFPHLSSHAMRASNAEGWGAGRTAADLASFDVHRKIGRAG